MNIQKKFIAAVSKIKAGLLDEGMNQLKDLAGEGHLDSALHYGEHLFRKDFDEALRFFDDCWVRGIYGTRQRFVMLKTFFSEHPLNENDIKWLHSEALLGHIESLLILINLSIRSSLLDQYLLMLEKFAPGLAGDLGYQLNFNNVSSSSVSVKLESGDIENILFEWRNKFNIQGITLNLDIGLVVVRGLLSNLECEYFKIRLENSLKPAMVHDPISGKGILDKARTASVVQVSPELLDWFSLQIDLQLQSISGVSRVHGEPLNLLYYKEGQEYKPHYDAIVGKGEYYKVLLSDGGQRIKTALCYLSDGYNGGHTIFPKLELKFKGGKGDVLSFDNLTEDGVVQKLSYHASSPIISGQKWVLNKWIRKSGTRYGSQVYTNGLREKNEKI